MRTRRPPRRATRGSARTPSTTRRRRARASSAVPRAACGSRTSAPRAARRCRSTSPRPARRRRRTSTRSARPRPSPRSPTRQRRSARPRPPSRPASRRRRAAGSARRSGSATPRRATGRCSQTPPAAASTPSSRSYRGATLAGLVQVACNDDIDLAGGNRRSRAQLPVTAGQTYYLQVGGFKEPSGAVGGRDAGAGGDGGADGARPTTPSPLPPRSARCPSAAPAWTRGRRRWRPASRPRRARRSAVARGSATSRPATPTLVADSVGSDFDTVLAVYRGTALGALTAGRVQRRHRSRERDELGQPAIARAVRRHRRTDVLRAGRRLPRGRRRGRRRRRSRSTSPPTPTVAPNDAFAAALVAGPLPFTRASLDTRQAGDPRPASPRRAAPPVARTVWFRYTAPADATLVADTIGSDFDTVLAVVSRHRARRADAGRLRRRHRLRSPATCARGCSSASRPGRPTTSSSARSPAPTNPGRRHRDVQPRPRSRCARPTTCSRLRSTRSRAAVRPHGRRHPRRRRAETGEPTPTCAPLGRSVWLRLHPAGQRRPRRRHGRQRLRHRARRVPRHRAGRADRGRLQRRHRSRQAATCARAHAVRRHRRADVLRAGRRQARAPAAATAAGSLSISLTAAAQARGQRRLRGRCRRPRPAVHARGARHAGGDRRDGRVRAGVHERHRPDRLVPLHADDERDRLRRHRSAATSTPCSPSIAARPWER